MSRFRDAVMRADTAALGALAAIVKCPGLLEYQRNDERRWRPVELYLRERDSEICTDLDDVLDRAMLKRACVSLGLSYFLSEDEIALEAKVVAACINALESSSSFKRAQLVQSLQSTGGPSGALLAGTAASGGMMALLSSGGFGTYIAMSTALSAASTAVGITLPFAAYTGASTILSVALGPVGWIGLGIAALFALGAANGSSTTSGSSLLKMPFVNDPGHPINAPKQWSTPRDTFLWPSLHERYRARHAEFWEKSSLDRAKSRKASTMELRRRGGKPRVWFTFSDSLGELEDLDLLRQKVAAARERTLRTEKEVSAAERRYQTGMEIAALCVWCAYARLEPDLYLAP